MLNAIKMEIYTCFKGKMIWIVLGVVLVLSVISLYTSYNVLHNQSIDVYGTNASKLLTEIDKSKAGELFYWCKDIISGDFLIIFTIIFSALIVGKDYTSGYIKSIINRNNRLNYVVSKITILIIFVALMIVSTVLATAISNIAFLKTDSMGACGSYFKMVLMQILLNIAIGVLVEAIAMISKKQIVALIAPLVYYLFFSEKIYNFIDKFVGKDSFKIAKYTLFGAPTYLVGDLTSKVM